MHRIRYPSIVVIAVAGAVAAAIAIPVGARGEAANQLYLGTNLHFTSPTTSAGTFVASGAVADSGTVTVDHLALVPTGKSDSAELSGTETFTSATGSIVTRFAGIAYPLSSPHQVGKGEFRIVSGSGAYANLRGHGVFLIVVDPISNELVGTEEGSVGS